VSLLWILLAFQVAIVVAWCWGMAWVASLRAGGELTLAPLPGAHVDGPRLAIVIAAHNEQDRIDACLRRLLAQNYRNLHITVVNDRSDDRTRERIRGVMTQDPRVSLVDVDELPSGWTGKTHALSCAVREVNDEYILFTDCDCRLAPGALAAVMQKVLNEGIDFVSLWPRLELLSTPEKLVTPAAAWLLGVWGLARSAGVDSNSQIELGNGQFLLFSKRAYVKIGGHAAVSSELAEDLILARKVADSGLRRWIGLGKGLYVTSRDNTFSQTVNSLTRVLIGSLLTPWRIAVSAQLLQGGVCSPILFLPMGVYLGLTHGWMVSWLHAGVCVLHLMAMQFVVCRLFAITIERPPTFFSFLKGSVVCLGIVYRALLVISGRGSVRWGKTAYRVRGSQIVAVVPATR
jgi:hypothetical protein